MIQTYEDDIEFWKFIYIHGEKTKYQVSNNGRIRNTKSKNKILAQIKDKYGYSQVCLFHNNHRYSLTVHRLVAIAFIPNKDNKPQVNHRDGIKQHNYIDNLEWVTAKENIVHSYKNGLHDNVALGENHGNNIYSENSIKLVCKYLSENKKTYNEIVKLTGVPASTIRDILSKKYWTHISNNYKIDNYTIRDRKPVDEDFKKSIIHYALQGKNVHEIRLLLKLQYNPNLNAAIQYYVNKSKKKNN